MRRRILAAKGLIFEAAAANVLVVGTYIMCMCFMCECLYANTYLHIGTLFKLSSTCEGSGKGTAAPGQGERRSQLLLPAETCSARERTGYC